MSARDEAVKVLRTHRVECTGLGEVTCGSCRDLGWMPWPAFYQHIAAALDSAGFLATEQEWGVDTGDADHPEGQFDAYPSEHDARITLLLFGGSIVSRRVAPWREAPE